MAFECPNCELQITKGRVCQHCGWQPKQRENADTRPNAWPSNCQWSSGCIDPPTIWIDGERPYCLRHSDISRGVATKAAGPGLKSIRDLLASTVAQEAPK